MKCPKCGYLGFDHVDRCRNCGYDFSLAAGVTAPELPLRAASQTDGFADLSLVAPRAPLPDPTAGLDTDLDRILGTSPSPAGREREAVRVPELQSSPARTEAAAAAAARVPAAAPVAPAVASSDSTDQALPLFGGPITDDVPLITKASPPRPPLSVRRATPEVPRLRAEPARATAVDLRLDLQVPEPPSSPADGRRRAASSSWAESGTGGDAGLGSRLVAVMIDVAVLAVVDALVVYFTMQICGLTLGDANVLPKVPLLAFLAVQNGGYLIAFTAGGQTLGKMATGIRVVTDGAGSSLDVGHAALRTLAWIVLAIPAGLGFLSAVFSADHRGLHDKFAGSRVVRASA